MSKGHRATHWWGGIFRGQLREIGHSLVWISGSTLTPLAQSKEPWLGQITCFAKFTGENSRFDTVNQPTLKVTIRAPTCLPNHKWISNFPWSASSHAHLPAGAHQVLWCLLNEDIWNPSHSREDGLASATVMRWKVLSQPAHLHRAGFLLSLGRLSVVWSKQVIPCSLFGASHTFLKFQAHLNTSQLYLLLHSCIIRSMMWYFTSPYEQHIPRSSYRPFMLHDSRCFIQEHISHGDNWFEDKKSMSNFQVPSSAKLQGHAQSLCILNSFSSFLLILHWYYGSNPAFMEG